MTTYKQNVPEQIWVSPEIYGQVLTHLDPFVNCGFPHAPIHYSGRLIDGLVNTASEVLTGEDELEQARR